MQTICIRVDLDGEAAQKFKVIKDATGFPTNKSVVIHLINDRYDQIVNDSRKGAGS